MARQQHVAGPSSPPQRMGNPAQRSPQPSPQVPFATPALPPAPNGYQYQLVLVPSSHQPQASPSSIPSPDSSTTPNPAPVLTTIQATGPPATLDYPYILTGKLQMTLFTPDRSRALFIVDYPDSWSSSWSKTRNMTIFRASNGEKLANAEFHSFTSKKVDLYYGGHVYHFKKRFASRTGLGSESRSAREGDILLWDVWGGEMMLTRDDGLGGIGAKFIPRRDMVGPRHHTSPLEGRLELRALGLMDTQFEELFVTLVAEMERRKRASEEWAVDFAVMGHVDVAGTAAVVEQTAAVIEQSNVFGAI